MKIVVDRSRCQGHVRCHAVAPDLFELDELGQATVVGDGTVPAALLTRARLAAANCPELAIHLEESS